MKKLLILIALSVLLQASYFLLFMQDDFKNNTIYYNPISIISVIIFLLLYIFYTINTFKYGILFILKNIFIGTLMLFILSVIIEYLCIFLTTLFQIIYLFIFDTTQSYYENPMFGYIHEYNLVFFNFISFILNIIYIIAKTNNDKYDKNFNTIHKFMTALIIFIVLFYLFYNIHAFYFYIFLIIPSLIYWMLTPFLKRFCIEYHNFLSSLIIWGGSVYFLWSMINGAIETFDNLQGFSIK